MDLYNIESDDNEKNNIQITSEFSEQIPTPNDLDADVPAPERSRDNDKSLTPSEIKKIQTKINKNILLISFAFLLNFTSFGGLSKLQSSLHHAQGMGVITQSILYGVFVVSCLFIPKIVIVKIGHKWTIAVSFVGYILWMAANGYAVWATMLPASVLVGLCAAPLWTAQSSYFTLMAGKYSSVTQISQDDIVTRFFGIFFMFFQTHNIIGNIISSVVLGQKGPNATEPTEQDLAKCGADDCPWVRTNNTNLIKPSPDSSYISCSLGIWMVGLVILPFGVVNAACSLLNGWLVRFTGRVPLFLTGFLLDIVIQITLLMWRPHPQQMPVFFIISSLWGITDAIWLTQIKALYGILFPDQSEAAYSNYQLWESLGYIIGFAYNNFLCTRVKLAIIMSVLVVGVAGYGTVEVLHRRQLRQIADIKQSSQTQ